MKKSLRKLIYPRRIISEDIGRILSSEDVDLLRNYIIEIDSVDLKGEWVLSLYEHAISTKQVELFETLLSSYNFGLYNIELNDAAKIVPLVTGHLYDYDIFRSFVNFLKKSESDTDSEKLDRYSDVYFFNHRNFESLCRNSRFDPKALMLMLSCNHYNDYESYIKHIFRKLGSVDSSTLMWRMIDCVKLILDKDPGTLTFPAVNDWVQNCTINIEMSEHLPVWKLLVELYYYSILGDSCSILEYDEDVKKAIILLKTTWKPFDELSKLNEICELKSENKGKEQIIQNSYDDLMEF